jgi:hypothetical protein
VVLILWFKNLTGSVSLPKNGPARHSFGNVPMIIGDAEILQAFVSNRVKHSKAGTKTYKRQQVKINMPIANVSFILENCLGHAVPLKLREYQPLPRSALVSNNKLLQAWVVRSRV